MTKKKESDMGKGLIFGLILGIIIISFLNALVTLKSEKYCVEWDDFLKRENLLTDCYDLENDKVKCDYQILKNQDLKVYRRNGEIVIFECSKWVKAYRE